MARVITFTYDDTEYSIGFDRSIFVTMEDNGFEITNMFSKPMHSTAVLFNFGIRKYHPTLQTNKLEKLLDAFVEEFEMPDFMQFALEEYNSFFGVTQTDTGEYKKKQPLNIQSKAR